MTKEQIKENRSKWIKALRSGKYKQGAGALFNKKTKSYCCLGVLCHVAGIKPTTLKGVSLFDGATNVAPERAMEFVGLNSSGGGFEDHEQLYDTCFTSALWKLNDLQNFSFAKIADIIELEPKGLFND